MLHKRLIVLALSLVVVTAPAIVATRYISGQSNQQPKPLIMKVLRGKEHLKTKPTRQEIASVKPVQENERQLEDSIPKHVPLKIKIKKDKEKAFRDLKNEKWARDFELEVTNTGDKPIYEFYLLLVTDVKAAAGYRIVAPLTYGRPELADLKARPTDQDVPLQSGETYVLKIHPGQWQAWDQMRKKENRPDPKKIQIKLQGISFGDGTGYFGNDGELLPRSLDPEKQSNNCLEPRSRSGPFVEIWDTIASQIGLGATLKNTRPATFLPVNFLFSEPSKFSLAPPESC